MSSKSPFPYQVPLFGFNRKVAPANFWEMRLRVEDVFRVHLIRQETKEYVCVNRECANFLILL